jgi:hypothetical protein
MLYKQSKQERYTMTMQSRKFTITSHARVRLQQRFGIYSGAADIEVSSVFVKTFKNHKNKLVTIRFGILAKKPVLLIVDAMSQAIITVYSAPTKQSQHAFWNDHVKMGMAKLAAA